MSKDFHDIVVSTCFFVCFLSPGFFRLFLGVFFLGGGVDFIIY